MWAPIGARSKCGIKVKRGEKAKEIVMKHFVSTTKISVLFTRKKGNIQKYCYDIADAIIVARAGHILQEGLKKAWQSL